MEGFGNSLGKFGSGLALISGFYGYGLSLFVLLDWGGMWAVLAGILLFPAAFTIAPFYAGFWLDDWWPFAASFVIPAVGYSMLLTGTVMAANASTNE